MGCLLNFFLCIFILAGMGALRLWWQMRKIMRTGRQQGQQQRRQSQQQQQRRGAGVYRDESSNSASKPKKKVFADDEGEYVDFEEVKD